MPLFNSAYAKTERARQQIDALQTVFESFYKSKSYTIRQELYPQVGEKRLIFHADPLPLKWSVIIGEIVHDLRSALDHSIYELTCIETGIPSHKTEFPIFEDEGLYFQVNKRGEPTRPSGLYKIQGIKDTRRQAIIKGLQPSEFRKTHKPHEHPILAFIHELDIVDKHRTNLLCRMATTSFDVRWLRDTYPISNTLVMNRLEDGVEIAHWKPVGNFNDEVDMEAKVSFEIAFGDSIPILNKQFVVPVIQSLIRGVERVLHYLSTPEDAGVSTEKG